MKENRRPLLLLIDLQRAFCDFDGSMAAQGRPIDAMREAARNCQTLADLAHDCGIPVAWTRMMFKADYSDGGMVTRLRPGLVKAGALRFGTPDVELCSLVSAGPSDILIDKPRYSSVLDTDLESYLRRSHIGRVIVGGVTTSMCVETTVRDLFQRDFETAVIEDACADFDQPRHAASISAMAFGFARIFSLNCARALFRGERLEEISG